MALTPPLNATVAHAAAVVVVVLMPTGMPMPLHRTRHKAAPVAHPLVAVANQVDVLSVTLAEAVAAAAAAAWVEN